MTSLPERPCPFSLEIHEEPPLLTVRLVGELDLTNAPDLALPCPVDGPVDGRVSGRVSTVHVDLSRLSFCDVAGLRVLHALCLEQRAAGRTVALIGAPSYFRRIARITGLTANLLQEG